MLPTESNLYTTLSEVDPYTPIVSRVMDIQDVTQADAKQQYLVRYRGLLRGDSTAAYDQLAGVLNPMDITPLFRKENQLHVIYLMSGVIRPRPSKAWVNVLLFFLTVVSMLISGTIWSLYGRYSGPLTFRGMAPYLPASIVDGLAFTASLMAILLAHEFGHYLAGRYHKTAVTLPYYLPFPLSPFGTLGAFIQLKEPPKNKRILLDIGIAGPLAGIVVAIPILILGLSLSQVDRLPTFLPRGSGFQMEGNSLLYLFSKLIVFGKLLPAPISYGHLSPLTYWTRYFFTGQPVPLGGTDVILSPVAWAAWAGLLVTALNLIPAGQLDGGHIMYVLLGKRATSLLPLILIALVLLGFAWPGWWLWAFLIFLLGRLHAEPLDQITPLDPARRAVAVLGILIFFLVFTPVPLMQIMV